MKIIVILISILFISLAGGSNESLNLVSANEILDKFVSDMNVNYDSKIIKGDLIFNNSLNGHNEHIISNITIENSIIEGNVNISDMKFYRVSFFNSTFEGNFTALDCIYNDANFSDCSFRGFADFGGSKFLDKASFEKIFIKERAQFSSCEFSSPVDFHDAVFDNNADFSKIRFHDESNFRRITFRRYADFSQSVFYKDCDFYGANFEWAAYFKKCNFQTVDFSTSLFNYTSDFTYALFFDEAKFSGCQFINGITMEASKSTGFMDINNAIFGEDATFSSSRFADFRCSNCEFRKRCDFYKSEFKGDAIFKYSRFLGDSEFSGVKFEKKVDLSNCVFNNTLMLKRSNLTGSVNLMNSVFKKDILADDAIFNGHLNMNQTQFGKMYVRWFNLRKGIQYNETAYYLLIKNFKDLGLFSDANECYYAFMSEMSNQTAHQSFSAHSLLYSLLYSLSRFLYGFGTKPEYPLIWSGLFILIFAFYWFYIYKSITVGSIFDRYGTPKNNVGAPSNGNIHSEFMRLFKAIKFSLNIFLSGTKLFFDPPELPKKLTGSRIWMKRIYLAERTLGAGFFFLFFFAISKMLLSY